jgi:hypothetical protein
LDIATFLKGTNHELSNTDFTILLSGRDLFWRSTMVYCFALELDLRNLLAVSWMALITRSILGL